ncbi:hypothetical protein F5148DRAFT_872560 [Russula earlei]|uniref:Uncharacterized protein n=1 Tax=Russula earlei TaxID=71964 RepID=A0ACC0TSQ0_9AGAM|nr:hypothetical protein F5148DRAFT_872560 [Russula earlei]
MKGRKKACSMHMHIHIVALAALYIACCVPVEVEAMATSLFLHHPFVAACPQNFFILCTPQHWHPPNARASLCHSSTASCPPCSATHALNPRQTITAWAEGNVDGPAGKGCANKTHSASKNPEGGTDGEGAVCEPGQGHARRACTCVQAAKERG